jgi:HAD superfamily hydrolase (TIGR01509 family)
MNDIEAVIFDMDGLIVENELIQFESFNKTLSYYGVILAQEDFLKLVGKTQKEIFEEIKKKFNIETTIENLVEEKRKCYLQLIKGKIEPRPGFKELVNWVNAHSLKKGVASSSPKEDIVAVLRVLGFKSKFDTIVSSFELPNGKPDPYIFVKAAENLGVDRVKCVVLEDSAIGVKAAKTAGMRCIAVPSSFTVKQDFSAADFVAKNLYEAREQLEEWHSKQK